jgi:hypothetical protein
MKKLMLWIIALAALPGSALLAQSIAGAWQGALQIPQAPGGQLRIVIKVSTTDADSLKAVVCSIDQGGQPMNATTFTLQGSAVKIWPRRSNTVSTRYHWIRCDASTPLINLDSIYPRCVA